MNQGTTEAVVEVVVHPGTDDASSFEWCIAEIFGHRRHAGRAREEERFGSKMLRVDELTIGADGRDVWETFYYSGSAIFSYRPATEELVRRQAVHRFVPPYRSTPQIEDFSDVDVVRENEDEMDGADD